MKARPHGRMEGSPCAGSSTVFLASARRPNGPTAYRDDVEDECLGNPNPATCSRELKSAAQADPGERMLGHRITWYFRIDACPSWRYFGDRGDAP